MVMMMMVMMMMVMMLMMIMLMIPMMMMMILMIGVWVTTVPHGVDKIHPPNINLMHMRVNVERFQWVHA